MWKNKKIRSSTLIELILVMVLIGIVSSMAFSSMGIFVKNFEFFRRISNRNYELTLLEKLLTKDLFAAQVVKSSGSQELVCVQAQKEIRYDFLDHVIIRHSEITDTFHLKAINMKTSMMSNTENVVEKLTFDISIEDQSIPYIFTKKYAADVFINQDE